jgi:hypothetical protein
MARDRVTEWQFDHIIFTPIGQTLGMARCQQLPHSVVANVHSYHDQYHSVGGVEGFLWCVTVVMFWLGLAQKPVALAWLWVALASRILRPSHRGWLWPGFGLAWPEPWLMRWQCDKCYVLQGDKSRAPKKHWECITVVKATAETAAMVDAQLWHEFLI